ncbi:orf y [Abeliophyllum distichum]|uniref:Orf y n=1 Tax=Abeliophyllum distichum TaxID=126358 RepID=A0ABD1S8S2_9LAMI
MKIDKERKQFSSFQGENITKRTHIFITNEEIETFKINSKRKEIVGILDNCCSENPLDPTINKGKFTARIELLDEHKGKVVRAKAMAYSPKDIEEFAVQIKELLDLHVIEPSKSPFSSPAFMVRKEAEKRRGKARMVIDYFQLNKVTKNDGYILPNMQSLLQLIKGKKIFSSFDCKSGFHQVRFDEQTKPLTAFSCPQGHFQWTVVPFGLKQAPGIFQRHMDNTFKGFNNFCCVYIDDILIFSDSEEDHEKQVLQEFPDEIQDQKQLMRLLGCLTYAESFIQDLVKMRTPLQKKLKKDHKWNWTREDSNYVRKIKAKLKNLPPLYHPHKDDKMIIETDASQDFWGAALKAVTEENEEKLCSYASGTFNTAEKNYHINEKEILAMKKAITKFRLYIISNKFLIRTDSSTYKSFLKCQVHPDYKQSRLIRWQMWFSHYDFDIELIKSTKFYVIFDGPHRGYYTNWTQVEPLVKNKPYKHKSFKTYTEAQQSFDEFHRIKGQSPIPFKQLFDHSQLVFSPGYMQKDIRSRPRMPQFRPPISDNLKPSMSYKTAATSSNPQRIPDRFKVLGKIPERKEDFIITDIRLQDFMTLQEEARQLEKQR